MVLILHNMLRGDATLNLRFRVRPGRVSRVYVDSVSSRATHVEEQLVTRVR